MVMQITAASPSPDFHSGESYLKKITVYFRTICVNFRCKIERFELLKVVAMGVLETGFWYQGRICLTSKSSAHFFFMFNKFENCFTLVSNNIF